ncbi:arginine transporter ATP-binding subunit [Asaia sp. W19]|uniref:amino acid ABC transporter ATP-binding protein n=1 Tax=unclassified Asaia TaxID=2685023 RepID=UPI000F8C90C9|nr:amino acid ABC transporter ATP-binding protein [Asaia sp. W19]RUT24841.1 arginine transporter ATP-binding subunit [Asaia sp. W19]
MITLDKVSKSYGDFPVLQSCSAIIGRGEVVVVCGPSGSGKSTLIKCINAMENFDAGQITAAGIVVAPGTRPMTELRRKVGMVFQSFELFSHLTIEDNILLAPKLVLNRGRDENRMVAQSLLKRVGLGEHARKYPSALSGGQQQRAAIARALAMQPEILLFDEPTSALDPEMVQEVLQVMTELANDGMTMMCVTHEMGFARQVATRIIFVDRGQILDDCSAEAFFAGRCSVRARSFLTHTSSELLR